MIKHILHTPMFGKNTKYLIILALLAWITFSQPSVQHFLSLQ